MLGVSSGVELLLPRLHPQVRRQPGHQDLGHHCRPLRRHVSHQLSTHYPGSNACRDTLKSIQLVLGEHDIYDDREQFTEKKVKLRRKIVHPEVCEYE